VSAPPNIRSKQPTQLSFLPEAGLAVGLGEAQPFLKWAGGKSQLLAQFKPLFPHSIRSYCEPFIGGGAVFFHLKAHFPEMRARLRDSNADLINCYQMVRDQVVELMHRLDRHSLEFRAKGEAYYYLVRSQDHSDDAVGRAARMIFLNKTCYNGLWRVNSRGEFNVPIGSYSPEKVCVYDRENLLAAHHALKCVDLEVADFRQTLQAAGAGDFAYIDPPYVPLSRTASFTSYTKEDFGENEQRELASLFAAAAARGALLMLSNSDSPFVRQLYTGFPIQTVRARRAVNSKAAGRGLISELVVLSYSNEQKRNSH